VTGDSPVGPRVAVVVPCFNDGATVRETVRSVRAQDEPQELVVVDDGSTDGDTLRAFDELERDGVRVVHKPNGGLASARMAGVRETQARFVLPLDADDRLAPGALTALADWLERNPEMALAWGDYRVFGDLSYVQRTARRLDPWQLSYQNDVPVVVMLRREALLAAGGWRPADGYEDWDLWMGLAERGFAGARVPIVAFEYRLHGRRMLSASAERHGEIYAMLRSRHRALFERRRSLWRASPAPLPLKVSLPIIERLPLSRTWKRRLGGVACHLADRRGFATLSRRLRPR
jgi:glycosyltransferase involved in cell wall biosynthesis